MNLSFHKKIRAWFWGCGTIGMIVAVGWWERSGKTPERKGRFESRESRVEGAVVGEVPTKASERPTRVDLNGPEDPTLLWALRDIAGFSRAVAALPTRAERANLLDRVFGGLAEREPKLALDLLRQMPEVGEAAGVRQELAAQWSERAAEDAARYLAYEAGFHREVVARALVKFYESDPGAARRLLLEPGTAWDLEYTLARLSERIGPERPAEALALARALPDGAAGEAVVEKITQAAGTEAAVGAATLGGLDDARYEAAVRGQTLAWASRDGAAAAAWCLQVDPGFAAQLLPRVVGLWGSNDAPRAAAFVEKLADPALRMRAAEELMKAWSPVAPAEAEAWYQTVSGGLAK